MPPRRYLTTRARLVRGLLESMDDGLPDISRREVDTPAGFAESNERPCAVCHGRGHVKALPGGLGRNGRRPCPMCEGTGWRHRLRGDNQDRFDPYDESRAPLSGGEEKPRSMELHEIDRQLEALYADERSRAGHIEHEQYGWERRRRAMHAHGDYAALRVALEALGARHPGVDPHSFEGLELLAMLMPRPIKAPGWLERQVAQERRQDVIELAGAHTSEEIAGLLHISETKVRKILQQERNRRRAVRGA